MDKVQFIKPVIPVIKRILFLFSSEFYLCCLFSKQIFFIN